MQYGGKRVGPGRPRIFDPAAVRTYLRVRVTELEAMAWRKAAKGLGLSAFIRKTMNAAAGVKLKPVR